MAETENIEKMQERQEEKEGFRERFTFLVFLACLLSAGSLAYSTWSFMDLNQITEGRVSIQGLNFSIVGLSAAATMDLIWSATMVAEYKGRKILWNRKTRDGKREAVNILPHIGWFEVLAVAAMLGYHGHGIGNGAAVFTAILPIATKFTWLLALDDLRDPTAPTEEEKQAIAETRRRAKLAYEAIRATEEEHLAELEKQRRENERNLEDTRAAIEKLKLEEQAKFELEEAKLRGENNIKALRQRLNVELQMEGLKARQEIDIFRLESQYEMQLRAPFGTTLVGEVVRSPVRPALAVADDNDETVADLAALGLSQSEMKQADMARRYYAADHILGGVKKAEFCEKNGIRPPRLSEATTRFPREWFMENNLADWLANAQD